jgi:type I restriction enzyme S subunit
VKAGWRIERLVALSEISYGYTESASREPVGPRFLRITDIQDDAVNWSDVPYCPIDLRQLAKYQLAHGDIVFARTGATTGKSYFVQYPPEAVFASYLIRLRLKTEEILPQFVNLYFQTADYWRAIEAGSTGSAQGGFNASKLGDLQIRFPPIGEQQRIVAILCELFAGIAIAKANAEKNLQNARELFDGLTHSLFPHDSCAPAEHTLDELSELIVDCEHKTAPTQEHGIPSIRTPNIGRGRLLLDGVYRVSEETYREWTRRVEPRPGDLILAREAPAGNVAVIPDGLKVCLGQRTVLIRPKKDAFDPSYLAHLLLQKNSQRRLLAHSRGATVQHINVKDIRAFKVAEIPPLTAQKEAVTQINALLDQEAALVAIYSQKLAALDELKQSLLAKAFAGGL